ncbi:hypothetical protein [Baekduia soli]|nr:hypothetical protein [Baekduia soli]
MSQARDTRRIEPAIPTVRVARAVAGWRSLPNGRKREVRPGD